MSPVWTSLVLILALLGTLAPVYGAATEVWVDAKIGARGNKPGCGASGAPCGTIGYALSTVQSNSIEVVLVDGGTFSDPNDLNLQIVAKNVSFRPSDGTQPTVIDCERQGRFLTVVNPDLTELTVVQVGLHALTVQNCNGPDGGAVQSRGVVLLVVTDCNFNSNTAKYGGAISVTHRSVPNPIRHPILMMSGFNVLYNNTASERGGAIYSNYSSIEVSGTRFEMNAGGIGGGIYWLSPFEMKLTSSSFKSNQARNGGVDGGSAVFATSSSTLTVNDVTFESNFAVGKGTLALYFGPVATITNSTFLRNRANTGGGGLLLGSSTRARVTGTKFVGNGGPRGGAIMVNSAQLTASQLTITGNQAAFGGGIYFAQSQATVSNSVFDGNTAEDGAAVYAMNECHITLAGVNVANNWAKSEGSGLFCDKSTYTLNGMYFSNNTVGTPRSSSREQDVYCDTAEAYGYCYVEGDQEWVDHCKLVKDNSPKIPIPKWLIATIIGLAVFIFILIIAVAFWMYRVRRVKRLHQLANGEADDGYALVSDNDHDDSLRDTQLFGVITRPNDIHYADDTEDDLTTDDDDGLIRNRSASDLS